MLLGEPAATQFDLHFRIVGVPVRVTPWFWVAGLVFGWSAIASPGEVNQGVRMVLWLLAFWLSILIHELGHSMAMRYYGIASHVVLYHFGGLAIPGSGGWSSGYRRLRPVDQIVISVAGPAAQLALAAVVILLVRLSGHYADVRVIELLHFLQHESITGKGPVIPSRELRLMTVFLISPSIFWALLNLLPVYPLDGGQIARELFVHFGQRDAIRNSLIVSICTGLAVAIYGVQQHDLFLSMLFGSLALSSYQALQMQSGRGGYGGGPW